MIKDKFKYKDIDVADAAYILNLEHRVDRKDNTIKILEELNFTGWDIYKAVKIEDEKWKKYGCTQSHLDIFKDAIDKKYKSIVIIEDDIKVSHMATIDDFDSVFNGWNSNSQNYDLIALGARPTVGANIIRNSKNFGTCSNCLCTHFWYYTEEFMKYTIEELNDYQNEESKNFRVIIDEFICDCGHGKNGYKHHNKLFRVGITIPLLFTQSAGFSDIENNCHNYSEWIEYCYNTALKDGDEIFKKQNPRKRKIKNRKK